MTDKTEKTKALESFIDERLVGKPAIGIPAIKKLEEEIKIAIRAFSKIKEPNE